MSDKKRRRKSSHHEATTGTFHLLTGQLTARSHILNTDPEIVILEVCTIEASEYILCKKTNFALLNNPLIIGQLYNFSKLHLSALKIKSETVRCFRMTDETSWQETEASLKVYYPPSYINFTNLQGRVTKVDNDFGILFLKSVPVIISTCSLVAKIPMPKVDQKVQIFNVHRINDETEQVIYAMCVKSYLRILNDDLETSGHCNFGNKSPLLLSLGSDALRGVNFILWLQTCYSKVRRNLSEDFLSLYGILRSDLQKFYTTLVKNIASLTVKKSEVQKKSLLEEYLAPDHNSHCGILTEEVVPCSLFNLFEIEKGVPNLEEDEDASGMKLFWQFDVKEDLKRPLIGVISVKSTSHRLTINDSSGSLYCLIMPEHGQGLTQTDVARLNTKVVLFTDYNIIREKFTWTEGDQLFSQTYKCLAVLSDKITIVSPLTSDQRNSIGMDPQICSENPGKIGAKINYCISPLKEAALKQFLSQYIVVQHKTMASVPQQGKPARSYLLVSAHGDMIPSPSSTLNRLKNTSIPIFISLKGPLLGVHPLISVNAVYEIRFPIGFDVDFFRKGTPLAWLQSIRSVLPTLNCVTLPSCCEIYTVADNPIPTTVMKFRDSYGITECRENVNTRELINVMGYVVGRYHQDPIYDREKLSVKANGFGTPGSKVMAIILRDTPPESQIGSPITLYLSYWASLQYPIGLLPGSKVIFRFVARINGKEGSVYLRSSILTSLEILELPSTGKNNEHSRNRDLWGPRSALDLILKEGTKCCQWMTVAMPQLHRVSFAATCSICGHDYRNGSCTFVGCSVSNAPRIFAQVSFLIEDFKTSSTLVFVPDSLVSKLFVGSEELLENISRLTKRYGQLNYYRFHSSEDVFQLSMEQRVFRLLCKSFLTRNRFHLLCRKFNKRNDFHYQSDLQILFAVDINPISLVMAVS